MNALEYDLAEILRGAGIAGEHAGGVRQDGVRPVEDLDRLPQGAAGRRLEDAWEPAAIARRVARIAAR